MKFCLNNLLISLSYALDFIEIDLLGVATNHSKRVAYVSANIAKELGLDNTQIFDLITFALLHDIGRCQNWLNKDFFDVSSSKRMLFDQQHCIEGEKIINSMNLKTNEKGIILYHHEFYDGSGMFGKKGDEIPLFSQIITLADMIEKRFSIMDALEADRNNIKEFVVNNSGMLFNPIIVDSFLRVSSRVIFWVELENDNISRGLKRIVPSQSKYINWKGIRKLTSVLGAIIDTKSSYTNDHSILLAEKTGLMADFYKLNNHEKQKLQIAADLHDLGKLVVSNNILHKNGKLEKEEFVKIQEHPYYTRKCLEELEGLEDITEWASNHHEKLNGTGYPFGKKGEDLDFNSRLLMCLDIYQALVEVRPYKKAFDHLSAMEILSKMVKRGEIDERIVNDIDIVFA